MKLQTKHIKSEIILLIISSLFLLIFYIAFVVCNKIPYREIRINIESKPRRCPIDKLSIYLIYEYEGDLPPQENNNSRDNLKISLTPASSVRNKLISKRYSSSLKGEIDSIYCSAFPKDTAFIDSLVAMYKIKYLTNIDFIPLRMDINGLIKQKNDKIHYYLQGMKEKDTSIGLFTGYITTSFYHSEFSEFDITRGGLQLYTFKSPRFYSPYNTSQCYIRIDFKKDYRHIINLTDTSKNIIKIDFKGPAIFEAVQPKPDSTTISSIIYTDLDKIRSIVNSDGCFAKVSLPQTDNLQNIRNFILMTIITLLFTTVCTVGYKILNTLYRTRKRIVIKGFSNFTSEKRTN